MTVEMLQKELEKMPKDFQVCDSYGVPIVFVCTKKNAKTNQYTVCTDTKNDIVVGQQLESILKDAFEKDMDELDCFLEILERGFTLEDFKETEHYEYAKEFMEDHGLI